MQDDIKFVYKTYHPIHSPSLYGEQYFLNTLLKGKVEFRDNNLEGLDGAIINIRAYDNLDYINKFNADIALLKWCLIIVTGNESSFDFYQKIKHPNCKIWVQSPAIDQTADKLIGFGWPSTDILKFEQKEPANRQYDFSFSGNTNNYWRRECVAQLKKLPNTRVIVSGGFGQGLPYNEYLEMLSQTKYAACPSAISTPDSFRIYEALEMGCVPVLDKPASDLFKYMWGDFPGVTVNNWSELKVEDMPNFEAAQAFCKGWWRGTKEKVVDDLFTHVKELNQ